MLKNNWQFDQAAKVSHTKASSGTPSNPDFGRQSNEHIGHVTRVACSD